MQCYTDGSKMTENIDTHYERSYGKIILLEEFATKRLNSIGLPSKKLRQLVEFYTVH